MASRIGDVSLDDLLNNKTDLQQNTQAYYPEPTQETSGISPAIKRNIGGGFTSMGRFAQEVGLPSQGLTNYGEELQKEAGASPVQGLSDITEHPGAFVSEGLGAGVGSMAPTVVASGVGNVLGGIAGGAVGGPVGVEVGRRIGGGLARAAVNIPSYIGSNLQRQDETGEHDTGKAVLGALGQAATEELEAQAIGGLLPAGLSKKFGIDAVSKVMGEGGFSGGTVTRAVKGALTAGAANAAEEYAQQQIERAQAGLDVGSNEAIQEGAFNAALGAVAGGALGAGAGAINAKPVTNIPGMNQEFTNKDVEKSYKRLDELLAQRVDAEKNGQDVAGLDGMIDEIVGHLDSTYVSPEVDENGKKPAVKPVEKQEAEAVLGFVNKLKEAQKPVQEEIEAKDLTPLQRVSTQELAVALDNAKLRLKEINDKARGKGAEEVVNPQTGKKVKLSGKFANFLNPAEQEERSILKNIISSGNREALVNWHEKMYKPAKAILPADGIDVTEITPEQFQAGEEITIPDISGNRYADQMSAVPEEIDYANVPAPVAPEEITAKGVNPVRETIINKQGQLAANPTPTEEIALEPFEEREDVRAAQTKTYKAKAPATRVLNKLGVQDTYEVAEVAPKQFQIVRKQSLPAPVQTEGGQLIEQPALPVESNDVSVPVAEKSEGVRFFKEQAGPTANNAGPEETAGLFRNQAFDIAEDAGLEVSEITDPDMVKSIMQKAFSGQKQTIDLSGITPAANDGMIRRTLQKIEAAVNKVAESVKDYGIRIEYAETTAHIPDAKIRELAQNESKQGIRVRGLFDDNANVIYVIGNGSRSPQEAVGTLYHELVGHYGIRKILGNKFENYMERLLKSPQLTQKIYNLSKRWKTYAINNPATKHDSFTWPGIKDENGNPVVTSRTAAIKLADEYVAELARLYVNPTAVDKYGLRTKENKNFLDKVVGFIKHILKSLGFGSTVEGMTNEQILQDLSKSYKSIFTDEANKYDASNFKSLVNNPAQQFSLNHVNIGNEAQYTKGAEVANALTLKVFQAIAPNQSAKNKKQFVRNKLKEVNASKSEIEAIESVLETYPEDNFTWQQLVQDVNHVLMPLENVTTGKYADAYLSNIDINATKTYDIHETEERLQELEKRGQQLELINNEIKIDKKLSDAGFKALLKNYFDHSGFNLIPLQNVINDRISEAKQWGNKILVEDRAMYKDILAAETRWVKSSAKSLRKYLKELEGAGSVIKNVTRVYTGNFDTQDYLAGANHFPDITNYVGHVREFVRNGILHLFEVQSDLEQGGAPSKLIDTGERIVDENAVKLISNLERIVREFRIYNTVYPELNIRDAWVKSGYKDNLLTLLENNPEFTKIVDEGMRVRTANAFRAGEYTAVVEILAVKSSLTRIIPRFEEVPIPKQWQQLSKHIGKRMIRERVKQAAAEGQTKVRVATADTAARTEGWVERALTSEPFEIPDLEGKEVSILQDFYINGRRIEEVVGGITTGRVRIGDLTDENQVLWEVENERGNTNFVRINKLRDHSGMAFGTAFTDAENYQQFMPAASNSKTNVKVQPRYKGLYNKYKDIYQKMLEKEYGAVTVTDDYGNTWHEIDLAGIDSDEPVLAFDVAPLEDSLFNLEEQGFGKTNFDEKVSGWNRFSAWLAHKPLAKNFVHLGTLQYQNQLLRLYNKARGKTTEIERITRQIREKFGPLNKVQKMKLYEMLTEQNYDRSRLVGILPDDVVTLAQEAKDKISEYGDMLVKLGKLDPITYEQNKDKYLRTRYAKYLGESKGVGKIGSYQNYLKKKQDLPESAKAGLLEIKDPEFLLIDTLGTVGRDTALLGLLHNINYLSEKEKLGWVINNQNLFAADGTEMTLEEAKEHLEKQRSIIKDRGDLLGYDDPRVQQVVQEADKLEAQIAESYRKLDETIAQFSQQQGMPSSMSPKDYKDTYYTKLPTGKQYGKLSGLYVRKEIYDDLREGIDAFYNMNTQGKILKTMEAGHRLWKTAKVSWNLPTWFQNAFGNFGLLDLASPTNMGSLAQMTIQEIRDASKKQESKYWTLGQENGVFGTTLAAQELYTNEADFALKLKKLSDNNTGHKFADTWDQMKDLFLMFNEKTSNWYGLLEGTFKVVAIRDHIQRWEKETGQKFDDLTGNEREAVIGSAVRFANDAIFDYSAVPNWVKQIRRFPLGSPFLTFSYKALPAILKAMRYNPKKFIKYAVMPTLMMQIFLMANPDMDEEDYEEIMAKQPQYMKDKSSMYLLPWKNAEGKWEFWDAGYLLPWAPFVNWGLYVKNHFDAMNYETTAESTIDAGYELLANTFGFLGGPAPQLISVWKTGVDPFTKEPIFEEGQPASEKWWKGTTYFANMMMPSWLSGQGFAGKLQDALGVDIGPISAEPLNRYGSVKNTVGEAFAGLAGMKVKGVDPRESHLSNLKMYEVEEQKIKKAKTSELKNPNLDPRKRLEVIKKYNALLINQRRKRSEYLRSIKPQE